MEYFLQKKTCSAIVDTQGGELISFRDNRGTEYIWNGDPAYWSGRNPILFPIVGDLKNGSVRFQGTECKMPRHGFARRSGFAVSEHGADFIVLELRENPATLGQYPYPFLLRVTHQIMEDGFQTSFEVKNPGPSPLPFCIGAHTGFRCPLHAGEHFEEYELRFDHIEYADSIIQMEDGCLSHSLREPVLRHTDTIPLIHETFDRLDTLTFEDLRSKGVSLLHHASGHGVHMEFDGFPMIAFWTKPGAGAPFLCMEPWHGCAAYDNETGNFEHKPHSILLRPGERKRLSYTVKMI